jgi:hypothetical protein
MTTQVALPIALLAASFVGAAAPPAKEPSLTPQRKALDTLLRSICRGTPGPPGAAAEALAGVGGAAVGPIKAALGKKPQVTGWLIYALGRSRAPAALARIAHRSLAKRASRGI